jgi:hypothetical protein
MLGTDEKCIQNVRKPEERDHLRDVSTDRKVLVMLK